MTSTLMTGARRTVAVTAAALLLVAGCDDGTDQSAPPEEPAEQETQAAGEERADSEEEAPADDASAGEEGAEENTGTDDEQDTEEEAAGGSAEPISDEPCVDLTPEDISAVLGNEVGDRFSGTNGLPGGVDPDDIVVCRYSADTVEDTSASLHWIMPTNEWPDDMPEDAQEEQNENLAERLIVRGEPIEVEGANEATVEVSTSDGTTFVTIRAVVRGGVVLWSDLVTEEGGLDESDIPTAVELAELAISVA